MAAAAALTTLKITLKYTHEEMGRLLPGRFLEKFLPFLFFLLQ